MLGENCRLIDSAGNWIQGRENALAAIRAFNDLDTGFKLEYDNIVVRGREVLVRGRVHTTEPNLLSDTLWRIEVANGEIVRWQSFGSGRSVPLAKVLLPEAAHPPTSEDLLPQDRAGD